MTSTKNIIPRNPVTGEAVALLPCPFCGGEARLLGGPYAQETYSVWCNNSHHVSGTMDASETARRWNTRAAASHMGVQRPEDVARALYKSRQARKGLRLTDEQVDAFFAQYAVSDSNVSHGGWNAVWCAHQDAAAVLALPHTGQPPDESSVLQNDLRDMLIALGLPDGARPQSPHEVFRECIEAVKQLRAPQAGCAKEIGKAFNAVDQYLNSQETAPGTFKELWETLRIAVAAPPLPVAESGWQEIENAPLKKWQPFDTWVVHSEYGGRRETDCQRNDDGAWIDRGGNKLEWEHGENDETVTTSRITHYRPLPAPPHIASKEPK